MTATIEQLTLDIFVTDYISVVNQSENNYIWPLYVV